MEVERLADGEEVAEVQQFHGASAARERPGDRPQAYTTAAAVPCPARAPFADGEMGGDRGVHDVERPLRNVLLSEGVGAGLFHGTSVAPHPSARVRHTHGSESLVEPHRTPAEA